MISVLTGLFRAWLTAYKSSPIRHFQMRLKDPELDKIFQSKQGVEFGQRAVGYILFLLVMLLLQSLPLLALKSQHQTSYFTLMLVGATVVCMIFAVVANRYSSRMPHCIVVPFIVLVRSLLIIFITPKIDESLTCISIPFKLATQSLHIVLFLSEVTLFQARIPALLTSVLVLVADFIYKTEMPQLPSCPVERKKLVFVVLNALFLLIPFYASFYLTALSDLKSFLTHESNTKQ